MGLLIGFGDSNPSFAYTHYYGVEFDVSVSNPDAVTRIGGDMSLHQQLPVHNQLKRCLIADDGTRNYYCADNNTTLRDTGATAHLDGTDGQVMVELGNQYWRFESDGNKRRVLVSQYELPGFTLWQNAYVSAYEAALDRTNHKLASVVNTTAQYRGGGNQSAWDELPKSQLGMPATEISLTTFRTYARNRGTKWNCNTYRIQKQLYWLYVIEYATLNSQKAFDASLTTEGYHKGGLGGGVTTLNSSKWSTFNSYHPVVPCGVTNSLGNHTGVVDYVLAAGGYDTVDVTVHVPSYRGVENPFGHIWKWTDGALLNAGETTSDVYICDDLNGDCSHFSSALNEHYVLKGNAARSEGYVKTVMFGEFGDIVPTAVGASTTTYYCDYFYTNATSSHGLRGFLFGGHANAGASAGFACASVATAPSNTNAYIGSRLCLYTDAA